MIVMISELVAHMRMLRGNRSDKKAEQNFWMEANELRSISIRKISAPGVSSWIHALTSAALLRSLAGMTSLRPLFASTLAVSAPMPEVAPAVKQHSNPNKRSIIKQILLRQKNELLPVMIAVRSQGLEE